MNNPEQSTNDTNTNEAWQMEPDQQPEKVTDMDADQIDEEPPVEAASVKKDERTTRTYPMPDGTYFTGTPEEFHEAMKDYRDQIGAA
ncbi:hypothetical protein IKQ74_00780 [Candidatus Saccharibacteria bacterium]|jgi:hypothetical protein|nr:hypothetical protein [Candidatus Saccharibacteria bacterium]